MIKIGTVLYSIQSNAGFWLVAGNCQIVSASVFRKTETLDYPQGMVYPTQFPLDEENWEEKHLSTCYDLVDNINVSDKDINLTYKISTKDIGKTWFETIDALTKQLLTNFEISQEYAFSDGEPSKVTVVK